MFSVRPESPLDVPARERLLDRCFGAARFAKTCERLRAGRVPAEELAWVVACDERLVATVRLWNVEAGSAGPALMLGPIAVEPSLQGCGIGAKLMRDVLGRADALGHRAVVLVGDAPYYGRFGFSMDAAAGLTLPGPFDRARFLGLELVPGSLRGARGLVTGNGRPLPLRPHAILDPDSLDPEFARWNRAAA